MRLMLHPQTAAAGQDQEREGRGGAGIRRRGGGGGEVPGAGGAGGGVLGVRCRGDRGEVEARTAGKRALRIEPREREHLVDGPRSRIWPEAENRMHTARGLLAWLLSVPDGTGGGA